MRLTGAKHPGIVAIVVLVAGLLLWGFWPRPVLVETAVVRRAPLTILIEEEGRTRVIDRYVISAPVDGVACRIELDVGDPVEKGQVLLGITPLEPKVLDPRSRAQAAARVSAAKSALESARQRADSAKASANYYNSEIQRLRPLLDKEVVSKREFDKALMEVLTADANLRSANHAVDVARYEVEAAETALKYAAGSVTSDPAVRVPVRSPISGTILQLPRECEGPVQTGEELMVVGDPSLIEVEVDVLSADAVTIKPGMKVLFERWGGDHTLEGRVRRVEPVGFTKISALGVEEQRVNVIADFTSPREEWRRLGDGYRVEAKFVIWHEDDVLQTPASSLFRHGDGWAVFVIQNHRAERRKVTIGQRNGLVAQILQGIKEGETVIDHPSDAVDVGVRLKER